MKKSVLHLIKVIALSSALAFCVFFILVGFIRKMLENISTYNTRSFFLMALLFIIYSIFFLLFYRRGIESTYYSHKDKFSIVNESKSFLQSTDGKANLIVYGILAIILELSLLIGSTNKNPISMVFLMFFPFATTIKVIVLRSIISFILTLITSLVAVSIRSYNNHKYYK